MSFSMLARNVARLSSQRNAALRSAPTCMTRFYATTPSNNPPDSSQPPKQEETPQQQPETQQQDALQDKKNLSSSSLFDIDTSTSPLAQQLIEAEAGADGSDPKGSKKTGAKSKARSMSSIEKKRQTTTRMLTALFIAGSAYTAFNFGRPWSEEEKQRIKDTDKADSLFSRIKLRASSMYEDVNKPVWEKLLPDPLPFPYARPYTLVLDVDDLLLHSEWTREKGWRVAKRPGLDYFLGYLSQFFEIVIFTTQPAYIMIPIIEKLDPDRRFITYTLFRESCRTVDGKLVKDLNYLNRDPRKVVVMDTNPESFTAQPENGILVRPWKGEKDDRELFGYVSFLEAIGIYNIEDVRNTIKAYQGTHIPTEHLIRMEKLKQTELNETKAQNQRLGKIGSMFGGIKQSQQLPADKTWYEVESERIHKLYLEDLDYWKQNGEKIRQQMKDEQERQMKEMKLNVWSFLLGAPNAQQQEQQQQQQQLQS